MPNKRTTSRWWLSGGTAASPIARIGLRAIAPAKRSRQEERGAAQHNRRGLGYASGKLAANLTAREVWRVDVGIGKAGVQSGNEGSLSVRRCSSAGRQEGRVVGCRHGQI